MAWSSLFSRKPSVGAQALSPSDPAQAISRARRRVVGAAVLLVIGVIGFPLVFETQPRPTPIDVRIEIPNKDSAPPLSWTVPASAAIAASMPLPTASAASAQFVGGSTVASPTGPASASASSNVGSALPPTRPASSAGTTASALPATASGAVQKPNTAVVPGASPKPTPAAALPPARRASSAASGALAGGAAGAAGTNDGARARALLEGKTMSTADQAAIKPESAATPGRFVVQMGAFADAQAAQDLRQRAEQAGLKTYSQVVETAAGSRTRVRLGPFSNRADADKALARAKAAGLSGVVIAL